MCHVTSKRQVQIGNRLLYIDCTVHRNYGFEGRHCRLLVYIFPRVFSLDYYRQRIVSNELNFSLKKKRVIYSPPQEIMSFVIKNKHALDIVDQFIKSLGIVTPRF